ncbi:Uncharacterized protein GBIM_02946 [Gryllus bimaculatus]|nr:Uncharacterized protein GBIM_02946 [Gryllus bimaculatus]
MTEESPPKSRYWGEIPSAEEVPEDFADVMIQNTMKPIAVKLHEPTGEEEPASEELPPECSEMDETVIHTIKLLQYAKSMQSVIDKLKAKRGNIDTSALNSPPFPDELKKKFPQRPAPFCFKERISTPFMEGIGPPPHRLTETNARSILRKCVATIFAHIGYDDSQQVALDVMTDVSEEYFIKFTRLLRVGVDHEMMTGNVGFPDVMERTFHEMGIGSMLIVHNFYQDRILKYHQKVLDHCNYLAAEHAILTATQIKQETTEIIECKIENEDDYADVPEFHVPAALGDGTSAEQLRPSLEQGFKVLQKFEQEEQLQNLVNKEEILISDSPKH